jgi:xylulokinase
MGIYLGVDLGTAGCRAMAVREDGSVASSYYQAMDAEVPGLPPGWSEQDVTRWWPCVRRAILETLKPLREEVAAVCVDSTSGTVLAVDRRGRPLTSAIMYNDGRASEEASTLSEAGAELEEKLGYRFRPSFSIAKLLWLRRNRGNTFASAHRFVHAADFVSGMLIGGSAAADHSTALKSAFDLVDYEWPDFLGDLGIPEDRLPEVVPPGTEIGRVTESASHDTGLPPGAPVIAGLTDGCASQIASGAAGPGDWETTVGTTLVIKGVTEGLLKDPLGRIYSHLHPEGFWMPGGASSTGGECLSARYPGSDLGEMDRKAMDFLPTDLIVYPLVRTGERFPFVAPKAEGFVLGSPLGDGQLYAAHLEGVGYLERMAYDLLDELGGEIGPRIFAVGGGARSLVWLQVRANILGKSLLRPRTPEAAMGVAILAASSDLGIPLGVAAGRMVQVDLTVVPDEDTKAHYSERYEAFRYEIGSRFGDPRDA